MGRFLSYQSARHPIWVSLNPFNEVIYNVGIRRGYPRPYRQLIVVQVGGLDKEYRHRQSPCAILHIVPLSGIGISKNCRLFFIERTSERIFIVDFSICVDAAERHDGQILFILFGIEDKLIEFSNTFLAKTKSVKFPYPFILLGYR